MTNPIPQDELIALAKEAGFEQIMNEAPTLMCSPDELAKFAQLIQQRDLQEYEQMKADAERYRLIRNPGFSLVGIVDGDMRLIEENEVDSIIDEIIENKK